PRPSPSPSADAPEGDPVDTQPTSSPSPFAYVRSRLGLGEGLTVDEIVVESPFDFAKQALLYTPRDLPPPASHDFTVRAAARVAELVGIVGGGCFVLTTSLRSMRAFH